MGSATAPAESIPPPDRPRANGEEPVPSQLLEAAKLLLKSGINFRGARREYQRRLFLLLARHFTPYVASDLGRSLYLVSTADDGIGNEVFLRGDFDREQQDAAYRILRRLGYGDFAGRCFVDVGANLGTNCISALMERGFASAVALEPDPETHRILRMNVAANALEARIRTLNLALGAADGSARLALNRASPGSQGLLSPEAPATGDACVTVALRPFDALVRDGVIPLADVGLVWIDTQGHEAHVLSGARTLLESEIPVIIEYAPGDLARSGQLDALHDLIRETYAGFVNLREDDPAEKPRIVPAAEIAGLAPRYPASRYTDLLLLKRVRTAMDTGL